MRLILMILVFRHIWSRDQVANIYSFHAFNNRYIIIFDQSSTFVSWCFI